MAKVFDEARFQQFTNLFFSDKYLKVYGKEQNLTINRFTILLFVVQIISFGLLLSLSLNYFEIEITNHFILIFSFLLLFILFKFYFERIIAHVFNIDFFAEQLHFQKVSYRNLTALILLPFITLLVYSPLNKKVVLFSTIFLFLLLNLISMVLTLKNHQKSIANRLFYFILYLCTLEIAPYLIMVKLLTFK